MPFFNYFHIVFGGKQMSYCVNAEKGIVNTGNLCKIRHMIKKAQRGEKVTLGFIGGSITQGCLSTLPTNCYTYLVYQWFQNKFPQSEFVYVNGGIGGTTSQFGVARVEEDILSKEPDFLVVEFSVNDDNNQHFLETYEGLIRKIIKSPASPAILILHNVYYEDGRSAQEQHIKIGKAYGIPCVSMREAVYPDVEKGIITSGDVTADDLHPNDAGHQMLSDLVTYFLNNVATEVETSEEEAVFPEPITLNQFENSTRYQYGNCTPICNGFRGDLEPQENIRDLFKNGWKASKTGDAIHFEIEASNIAIQYRKTIQKPTPIALAIIDGDEASAFVLDGNFQETWGDSLHIDTILNHGVKKTHVVEIRIVETHENDQVPFYLTSVIGSF
jgi:lysophospholipase L1-like esterase